MVQSTFKHIIATRQTMLSSITQRLGVSSQPQRSKQTRQMLQLVVGIETAGVWQHPDPRIRDSFILFTDDGFRMPERRAVRADTKHGHKPRVKAADLVSQQASAFDEIRRSKFSGGRGRA